MKSINLPSRRKYGRVTLLKYSHHSKHRQQCFVCSCSCGTTFTTTLANLRCGDTKSCGCLNIEKLIARNTRHNLSRSKIYTVWNGMLSRCLPSSSRRRLYFDRGVRVCNRWKKFVNFLDDMGHPKPNETIDRIDNFKGYCKENCRWATHKIQFRNRTTNKFITWKEQTLCLTDWASKLNIHKDTLAYRLKVGWSIQKILTTPGRSK